MRSPTAAHVASEMFDVETDYAGLSRDADEPVTKEQVDWADTIVVMERRQAARLKIKVGAVPSRTRVVNLSIPDVYGYMQGELIEVLTRKLPAVMPKASRR